MSLFFQKDQLMIFAMALSFMANGVTFADEEEVSARGGGGRGLPNRNFEGRGNMNHPYGEHPNAARYGADTRAFDNGAAAGAAVGGAAIGGAVIDAQPEYIPPPVYVTPQTQTNSQ